MAFGAPSLKGRALRYLAQREHSRAELARKLRRFVAAPDAQDASGDDHAPGGTRAASRAAGNEQIEAALDDLAAQGLLSDARAAASVLHSQAARSGERRLRQALQAKGLAADLVADTLAQARGSEYERALALWQRRFGQAAQEGAERARQARYLQGRGFSHDVIYRVLRASGSGSADDAQRAGQGDSPGEA